LSAKIFFSYYYIIFLMSHFKSFLADCRNILNPPQYYSWSFIMPKFPYSIYQDVYTPPSVPCITAPFLREELVLSTSACKTTGNPRWIRSREPFRILVCLRRSFDRVRWFSAKFNMCTLLSLRWNNTRYLARDKCLSRRILESAEAVAELRIFPEAGVSPHKGSKGCPFFPPPCLSEAW